MYTSYNGEVTYLCKPSTVSPIDGKALYQASTYTNKILNHRIAYSYDGLTPTEPNCIINEQATNRKFAKKNYLQPIPTDQIKLNSNLKQNPQW